MLLVAPQWFSKDADILADLIHLKEQPGKVGPETTLDCMWRAVWGMLYADDMRTVSQSLRSLELMMAAIAEVCGAFGLTVSEKKADTMQMPIPHEPVKPVTINAAGQHYRQTASII